MAEVGAGAAHIMDITLEAGIVGQQFRLRQHGFDTAGGDHPSLMKSQRAEIAPTKAAAVVANGKAHLFNGRNALGIHRVHLSGKRQVIESVQRLSVQRALRRIHQQPAALTLL